MPDQQVPIPKDAALGMPEERETPTTKGTSLWEAAKGVIPFGAAVAAGAADPLFSPVTAPAAYFAAKGILSPRDIKEHPYRSTLEAATMALPGVGEAAPRALAPIVVHHPATTEALGGLAGGAAMPSILGSVGGTTGEIGSGLGGAYLGFRVAQRGVKAAEDSMIEDVIAGRRAMKALPSRLLPRLNSEVEARSSALIRAATTAGEKPNLLKVPKGLRETVQQMYEERVKNVPNLPPLVQTPAELAAGKQRAISKAVQTEEMHPEATAQGMAHAAGRASPTWVPARRGITRSITELAKYIMP